MMRSVDPRIDAIRDVARRHAAAELDKLSAEPGISPQEIIDRALAGAAGSNVSDLVAVTKKNFSKAERRRFSAGWFKRIIWDAFKQVAHERGITVVIDDSQSSGAPVETAAQSQAAQRLVSVARSLILPEPVTAMNTEVVAMSVAVFLETIESIDWPWENAADEPESVRRVGFASVALLGPAARTELSMKMEDGRETIQSCIFLNTWRAAGFPRLEISHKLAAALCLTDVPDDDIQAPWPAWSLVVPNGLLDDTLARVWCLGADPKYIVTAQGKLLEWSAENSGGRVTAEMVVSLVRGACLAMEERTRVTKKGTWGSKSCGKRRVDTEKPVDGVSYLLAHPVTVDLRDVVREAAAGRTRNGAPLKVQFTVRGHWRNQACGVGMKDHKRIWVQPYWKGPKDARILLRSHVLDQGDPEGS